MKLNSWLGTLGVQLLEERIMDEARKSFLDDPKVFFGGEYSIFRSPDANIYIIYLFCYGVNW